MPDAKPSDRKDRELEGRIALVTGASRGIGAACARALSDLGATLALAARSPEDLAALADDLPGPATTHPADLAAPGEASRLGAEVLESHGRVDVLVNNAGGGLTRGTHRLTEEDIDGILALNLRSAMILAGAVAPGMRERRQGAIINMSSINGQAAVPGAAVYSAAKAGLDGMTRSLSAEWGLHGVRVNSVAPGVIVTDAWAAGREVPGLVEALDQRVSLRRWGDADEIADVVAFLATDRARYVTGQTINVDGGLTQLLEPMPREAD